MGSSLVGGALGVRGAVWVAGGAGDVVRVRVRVGSGEAGTWGRTRGATGRSWEPGRMTDRGPSTPAVLVTVGAGAGATAGAMRVCVAKPTISAMDPSASSRSGCAASSSSTYLTR